MPVTLTEMFKSRPGTRGERSNRDLIYLLEGSDDDAELFDALQAGTPLVHDNLLRTDVELGDQLSDLKWIGIARYTQASYSVDIGQTSYAFNTSGGTQHVTQSLATPRKYFIDAPISYKGAIGVQRSSAGLNVEGCDIVVPVYEFEETHILADSAVTAAYKRILFQLTGKVCNADFKGCLNGECLFLGASGAKRGSDRWEINFRFAASENITEADGIMVGTLGPIVKEGWEYLWVEYEDVEDATAKKLVKQPIAAFVETVYRKRDFALLGIGTT